MGLFTPLSLEEARLLGARVGVDVSRVEPLAAGSVNSNFRITDAANRRYFARLYEEQGADGARAELRLLKELGGAGVPVVEPLGSGAGGEVLELRGKPFALYPWVEGEILCQAQVTPEHARGVGEALARLHLATPQVTPLAEGRFRVEDLRVRLDRVERESPAHRDAALHIRRRLDHYDARRNLEVPSGVIHGDLFRDNVLWQGPRLAALLDFESASSGPFAFDLMVTVLAWCYAEAFRSELVSAMLTGYTSLRPLERLERSALAVEGALACLRFATTRITDFSMRAASGEPPLRDFKRFLGRLEALEGGVLEPHLDALP
jgi:homoserine kinase type II